MLITEAKQVTWNPIQQNIGRLYHRDLDFYSDLHRMPLQQHNLTCFNRLTIATVWRIDKREQRKM